MTADAVFAAIGKGVVQGVVVFLVILVVRWALGW